MARRSVRVVLVFIALLATAVLGYRAMDVAQMLIEARRHGAALDVAADEALTALLDLRAAMHAYVAPGQGTPFWTRRVESLLDTVRQRIVTIDAAVATSGGSLAETFDGIDQLAAADRRARLHAQRNEPLLAGDVIFTEARDLLSALTGQVAATRYALRANVDRRTSTLQQEQAGLAAGGVALWVVVALLLLPGGHQSALKEPGEWRQELADRLKKPVNADDVAAAMKASVPAEPAAPIAPIEPAAPQLPVADVQTVAGICADLSTLTDRGALSGALERASSVIGAKGLIVWVASSDGSMLSPLATHGFDARMVARIGSIARDSSNLTAAAFRDNAPKIGAASGSAPAALAISLCGPAGPVGVLSAELREGRDPDDACVALTSIFAAQLATLALPAPVENMVERRRAAL